MKRVKLIILTMLAAISCKAPVDFDLVEDSIYLNKYTEMIERLRPAVEDLDAVKEDLKLAFDIMQTGRGKLGILKLIREIQKYRLNNTERAYKELKDNLDSDLNYAENVALLIIRCSMVEKYIPNAFTQIMPQEYYAYADIHPDVIGEIFLSLPSWTRAEMIIQVKKNIRAVLQSRDEALLQYQDELNHIECKIWEMEELVDEPNQDTFRLLEEIEEIEELENI